MTAGAWKFLGGLALGFVAGYIATNAGWLGSPPPQTTRITVGS